MFYIIKFDEEYSKLDNLQYFLCGMPNGTVLSYSRPVPLKKVLPKHIWVVWLDPNYIVNFNEQCEQLRRTEGIKDIVSIETNEEIISLVMQYYLNRDNSKDDDEIKWDDVKPNSYEDLLNDYIKLVQFTDDCRRLKQETSITA